MKGKQSNCVANFANCVGKALLSLTKKMMNTIHCGYYFINQHVDQ